MKHDYLYDSLYNRRQKDGQEHTINSLNQLLSQGSTSYTYDRKGNLIEEQNPTTQASYTYDALNRLTSLTRDGERYEYQYDAFNRRIQKITPEGTERYLYIDQNEIGLVNEQDRITQLRILGLGKGAEIGSAIALELEGQTYIPYHDHAGHLSALVNLATGQLAETYTYTAFGEEMRHGEGTPNPWHFSSKRLDPESGWIYFGRRYYDPSTGRWTTPDPIGFADGPNLYAYVHNNPLTHFDLYGLADVPGPATGSSGTASGGTNSGPSSAPSRPAQGSSSGATCQKWDFGAREENNYTLANIWNCAKAVEAHAELNAAVIINRNTMQKNAVIRWAKGYDIDLSQALEDAKDFGTEALYVNEKIIETVFDIDVTDPYYELACKIYTSVKVLEGYGYVPGGGPKASFGLRGSPGKVFPHPRIMKPSYQTRQIWSSTKVKTSVQNAYRHWRKHARDFPEIINAKQYIERAKSFINSPPKGTLRKIRENGEIVLYHPETNVFGIYQKNGIPKTFYKPNPSVHPYRTNLEYFYAQ